MISLPADLWEQIAQSSWAAICVFDTSFRLIAFNKAHNDEFFRVNGYYTKIGDVFPDLFVPEQAKVMRAQMARALTGEIFSVVEEFGNPVIGHPCWEISYAPIRDADGTIVGAFHVALDVGPRLRAEAALSATKTLEEQVAASTKELRENRARLHSIFETSLGFQALLTKNGVLIDANAAFLEAIGQPLRSVVGATFWETPWFSKTPSIGEVVRAAAMSAAEGAIVRQEIQVDLPVGGLRWFDFAMRPIRDEAADVVALAAEAVETTERRHAEEALRQSQKMEAVGQLTGGIAHDFNNLLMAISGNLQLAKRRTDDGHPARRYLDNASLAVDTGAKLTSQLLAFSRTQKLDISRVELDPVLRHARDLVSTALGPNIDVQLRLDAEGLWTMTDADQLRLAILNLALNSRDAMPEGGSLVLASGSGRGRLKPDGPEADYLWVRVVDTGCGMPADVVSKAFDPFFTTKPRGQGTGLGLAQVYGFALQSNGDLRVSSSVGAGTTIEILLPRVEALTSAAASPGESRIAPLKAGDGRLLLVIDDDHSVRSVMVDALEAIGFKVVEAASGEEGLRLLEQIRPDAAIIDFVMPGMNGAEVGRRVQSMRPGLPIVFVSGYFDTIALDGISGAVVLRKPFDVDGLNRTVRELIH
ncbi:hybrid sensor histidine kinase/response regulator [Lichenifustis flavocetrariae]|uniref:histidine kinase n=1 Tax=Lichenifustis flavocetrariae TaxID=2949735 RepID=A0AA41YTV0_9HYPH|nr:PAS domain-containing protein [Lichenifustis flavocetrariae]MCW6508474.1 PAS domain-containing protein [Lichenifustis flavocetrariae]